MKIAIPRRIISVALLALLLAASAAYLAWNARNEYHLAIHSNEQQNLSSARALAEHAARTFDEAARQSLIMRDELEQRGVDRLTPAQIGRILQNEFHELPYLLSAVYIHPDGRIVAGTIKPPKEGVFVADREYFTHFKTRNSREPFIGRPLLSRVTGAWIMPVVVRVNQSNGSFGGLIFVSLRVDYFQSFYRSLNQQQKQRISLLRTDGWLLAAVPANDRAFTVNVANKPLLKQHIRQASSGVFHNRQSGYDDADLLVAYAQLPSPYPVVAVVSVRREVVLAPWRQRTVLAFAGASALLGLIAALMIANYRRMQRLEDAQHQLQRYQLIVESSDDAIYSKSPDGTILSWNPGAVRLYGYEADEVLGKNIDMLLDQSLDNELPALLARIMAGETVSHYETVRIRKDGIRLHVSLTQSGIRDVAGQLLGVAVIARDITQRKLVEQEVLRAKDMAEAATRTKSQFLANMSHEIRTPLNAIMGLAHLASTTGTTPQQQEYLDQIRNAGKTLLSLINDILDLSKVEAGRLAIERVPFSLAQVLEDLAALMKQRAEEQSVSLSYELASGIPARLLGDPLRLEQVLINLVGNALKFTLNGEVVLRVLIYAQQNDQLTLRFEVQDSGIGIPVEQQITLFQPFTQADSSTTRRFGGTGLGLAISQELVHLMGGEIFFASQEGQGSVFSFSLPFGVVGGESDGRSDVTHLVPLEPDAAKRIRPLLEELDTLLQKHNMAAYPRFVQLQEIIARNDPELAILAEQILGLEFDAARSQLLRVAQKLGIG